LLTRPHRSGCDQHRARGERRQPYQVSASLLLRSRNPISSLARAKFGLRTRKLLRLVRVSRIFWFTSFTAGVYDVNSPAASSRVHEPVAGPDGAHRHSGVASACAEWIGLRRHITVGSTFAYCQLLNQPIHTRPPVEVNRSKCSWRKNPCPIGPENRSVRNSAREGRAVKLAESRSELRFRRRRSRIAIDDQHHFFSFVPRPAVRSGRDTPTVLLSLPPDRRSSGCPFFEIGRVKYYQCSFISQHRNHHPLALRRVQKTLGSRKSGRLGQHGIARVVRPAATAVVTEGDVLFLPVFVSRGVDRNQA